MSISYASNIRPQILFPESSAKDHVKAAASADSFRSHIKESVVDEYKRKHPDHARHVEQQVRAGRAVREKNGAAVSTESMTMAEYQAYFYALLNTIPYDSTRVNDTTTISISDNGWEQMRNDPDYEAWVLGYFVEDRAVRNPFFGWGSNDGCIIFERFGASIEEHRGDGFSKSLFKGNKPDDDEDEEEDWWIKRHKRMKKLLKEQVERKMKEDALKRSALQKEYAKQQYISRQRQHSFLTTGTPNDPDTPLPENPLTSVAAFTAYDSILSLFSCAATKL